MKMKNELTVKWTHSDDVYPDQRNVVKTVETPFLGQPDKLTELILRYLWGEDYIAKTQCGGSNSETLVMPEKRSSEPSDADITERITAILAERDAEQKAKSTAAIEAAEQYLTNGEGWRATENYIYRNNSMVCEVCDIPRELQERLLAKVAQQEADEKAVEAAKKAEREEKRRADEAKKAAQEKARDEYIAAWAAEHGSQRLRDQIELKLNGWPLYLHERLAADFEGLAGSAELDNDGENEPLNNPSAELCSAAKQLKARLIELGISEPIIQLVKITWKNDDDDDDDVLRTKHAVVCGNYIPGPAELGWKTRNIRLII
jgi:hypothetical protein